MSIGAVKRSWPPPADSSAEWLLATLDPGTYYIRVEAAEDGVTSYRVRFGLQDPVAISVADARAEEGVDASLDFEVTLDRGPGRRVPISVRYTTRPSHSGLVMRSSRGRRPGAVPTTGGSR